MQQAIAAATLIKYDFDLNDINRMFANLKIAPHPHTHSQTSFTLPTATPAILFMKTMSAIVL